MFSLICGRQIQIQIQIIIYTCILLTFLACKSQPKADFKVKGKRKKARTLRSKKVRRNKGIKPLSIKMWSYQTT
jgi:hypothetical protein